MRIGQTRYDSGTGELVASSVARIGVLREPSQIALGLASLGPASLVSFDAAGLVMTGA